MPLTLSFQSRESLSASDFSVSESQVDKKWRKQMVGLKFLFARLAGKESFPQGVSASDLLFCSEENSLSRLELARAPVSGHGLEETSRQLGKRVQGAWAGKARFLTLPATAPPALPGSLLFPASWTWGFPAPSLLARGLVRAARTLTCAERLANPDEQAACCSLRFPGGRATAHPRRQTPGGHCCSAALPLTSEVTQASPRLWAGHCGSCWRFQLVWRSTRRESRGGRVQASL